MANMSYCRFQNTAQDFSDAYMSLGDRPPEELSEEERRAFLRLLRYASQFVEDYGHYLETRTDG